MQRLLWLRVVAPGAILLVAATARGQTTSTPTLAVTDFTWAFAAGGTPLTTDEVTMTYFSHARCACPTTLSVTLALTDDGVAKLAATDTVNAQFMIGNGCNIQPASCMSVGAAVELSPTPGQPASVSTSAVFQGATGGNCSAPSGSIGLWAIVNLDGAPITSQPSLLLTVGGAGPSAPTAVMAVSGDQDLLVSWTPSGDATTLQGYQVLCAPGPASPGTPAYDTSCSASLPTGGTGPFAAADLRPFICSGLISANSTRIQKLTNGQTYQVAVVAVGIDGTPSAPSEIAEGTPAPTVGFGDLYKEAGGTAEGGCSVAGADARGAAIGLAIAAVIVLGSMRRRRRRPRRRTRGLIVLLLISAAGARSASATTDDILAPVPTASDAGWNVELRFGPYRPDVDSEFADRGQSARPYAQIFGSSQHLMMQLEIDRQFSHRGGTWAGGVGVGYFSVTAAALSADLQSPSGDQTGLRLIPLSASLVYRADQLRRRFGSPLVPYAKTGLDCTFWQITDTSQPNFDGHTFGWHAAAGITVDLSPLDREAAESLRRESGVDQLALFAEAAYFRLDNFGSGSALRVGDTTWFAGLMIEF